MTITWLGHACFLLEEDQYRVVVDPYTGIPGYPNLKVDAHEVYCSHEHFDHHEISAVNLLPKIDSPFSISEIPTFHDDQQGALRGENMVRVFSAGGVRVCHLGDLGHQLNEEQAAAIGRCDVLLIPVGGVYTVDAEGAKAVCEQLRPRYVVPMHYHHAPYGLESVAGVEPFLQIWPQKHVRHLDSNFCSLPACIEEEGSMKTENEPVILVPTYPG